MENSSSVSVENPNCKFMMAPNLSIAKVPVSYFAFEEVFSKIVLRAQLRQYLKKLGYTYQFIVDYSIKFVYILLHNCFYTLEIKLKDLEKCLHFFNF